MFYFIESYNNFIWNICWTEKSPTTSFSSFYRMPSTAHAIDIKKHHEYELKDIIIILQLSCKC